LTRISIDSFQFVFVRYPVLVLFACHRFGRSKIQRYATFDLDGTSLLHKLGRFLANPFAATSRLAGPNFSCATVTVAARQRLTHVYNEFGGGGMELNLGSGSDTNSLVYSTVYSNEN